MNDMLLRAFQSQILLQCQFLVMGANDLNAAMKAVNPTWVFCALQNILTAGANISKALWGQGGRLATQRQALRDSIGISDDSVLRQVTMRNNFEHFDERLDRWFAESTRHNMGDILVGPANMISGLEEIEKFRHYNPAEHKLIFWGQEFDIQELISEVDKIHRRLQAELDKPRRGPASSKPQE